jgi:hypothetical protein
MELEELKSAWQALDRQLKRESAITLAMYTDQKLAGARSTLRPLARGQMLQLFGGMLVLLLSGLLWSTGPTAISVIVAGVVVNAYGIASVISAGMVLGAIAQIDYSGSVLEIQDRLARVRRAYIVSGIVAGLPWWFLWLPFLMVILAFAHVNLYASAPSVVWIGLAIGVAGLLGTRWLYAYSRQTSRTGLRRAVDEAVVGLSLQRAQAQLDEIRRFGEEQSDGGNNV